MASQEPTWNWQRPEWPIFTWDAEALKDAEARFLHRAGLFQGALRHMGDDDKDALTVEIISAEAYKTSEIEGEFLDRESLQSSLRRNFGLSSDERRVPPAEQGIADMMTALYRGHDRPLRDDTLFAWHRMIMGSRRDLRDIATYRTHPDPMQVVSGVAGRVSVHFEAPPSASMNAEMARFLAWFNSTGPASTRPLAPLARAGIAHLWFVCIHPFEDGNGRIGRAIAEQALSQALGRPTLIALSHAIETRRKGYYQALEDNNKALEITDWLVWFADTVLAAQERSQTLIDFVIEKTKFLDRLRGRVNERQMKALLRMLREGPDGFIGGLSAENYIRITGTSRATATRDLSDLVQIGAVTRTGRLKSTRYFLNVKSGGTA
ncbi:MAG: Fic family protein [Alphaproteobacteria bacterium]|nr:Fic family protein [Alphaproteobacteria bacterium]